MTEFRTRLLEAVSSRRPILLDGPLGTELARRGADASPPLWSARAIDAWPRLVVGIHRESLAAGAEILTANTFRTHARNLRAAGVPTGEAAASARALTARAVALSREAIGGSLPARPVFVAGSIAPLEDCYRPDLVPDAAALAREHRAQAEALAAASADLLLVETMNTVREALAAARAGGATGLPVIVSFVTDDGDRLLSGEPLRKAALALLELPAPPVALGVNCVPARDLARGLEALAAAAPGFPLVAYGNAGRSATPADEAAGRTSAPIGPADYARLASGWVALGARIVGSCCGTSAAHVAAVARTCRSAG